MKIVWNVLYSIDIGWPPQHIDGLVQERRKSSALAMELSFSCTKPSMYGSKSGTPLPSKFSVSINKILQFLVIFIDL